MGFGRYAQKNTPAASLDRVVGEGETQTLDIYAHVQAGSGINVWAGCDSDGTPVHLGKNSTASAEWKKGQAADKVAAQPRSRSEAVKR